MSEATPHQIPQENLTPFILGGKATITIHNKETQNRFTYTIEAPKNPDPEKDPTFFVSLLNGTDNQNSYVYIGNIFVNGKTKFWHNEKKSSVGKDAMSIKALDWTLNKKVFAGKDLPEQIEILHNGYCGVCGRKLTTPDSIKAGIGPVCLKKVGG